MSVKIQNTKKNLKNIFKKIVVFAGAFVLTIILNICLTAWEVLNDEWRQMGSPYDIKYDYLSTQVMTFVRVKLLQNGYSDANWFSEYLKSRQRKNLEKIKKVVGDDLIIDMIEYDINYREELTLDIWNEEIALKILSSPELFFLKPSKIKKVDEVERYQQSLYVLYYFNNSKEAKKLKIYWDYLEKLDSFTSNENFKTNPENTYLINGIRLLTIYEKTAFEYVNYGKDFCFYRSFKELINYSKNFDLNNTPNYRNGFDERYYKTIIRSLEPIKESIESDLDFCTQVESNTNNKFKLN